MTDTNTSRVVKLYEQLSHPLGEPENVEHHFLTANPAPEDTAQERKFYSQEADKVLDLENVVEIDRRRAGDVWFKLGLDDVADTRLGEINAVPDPDMEGIGYRADFDIEDIQEDGFATVRDRQPEDDPIDLAT